MENEPKKLFNEHSHLVKLTLQRALVNPHSVAKNKRIEYEDLVQYGNLGLWNACCKYSGDKGVFETYAINNIRWAVFDGLNRDTSIIRYNINNPPKSEDMYEISSIDSGLDYDDDESSTYHEIISSDLVTDSVGEHRSLIRQLFNEMTKREKEIVIHTANGLNGREIGELIGITPQGVYQSLKRLQNRFSNHKIAKEIFQ